MIFLKDFETYFFVSCRLLWLMKKLLLFSVFLLWPIRSLAQPVINEILWMGSDSSTTDEWIEIYNPESEEIDLSGWSVWSKSAAGEAKRAVLFDTGAVIEPDSYLVIARRSAATSALLSDPDVLSADLSLLNTGLYLVLRDAGGNIVDEADDGIGAPFAGANPSGGGVKASMERVDPRASGIQKENWRSASASIGLDQTSTVLASPGAQNFSLPPEESCEDPLEIGIAVQSGPLVGVGKVTLNLQAVALTGTLGSAACQWSYGDGFTSSSCNPPSHSFTQAGSFTVHLEVRNACGEVLVQDQRVEVLPDPSTSSGNTTWYDGSRLILRSALPNPAGSDTGKEWIEIFNPEPHAVSLNGWRLRVGKEKYTWYALDGSLSASAPLRVYGSEVKLSLPNTASEICLVAPNGSCISVIAWEKTEEEREYFSVDLRNVSVRGQVLRVIGSTVFLVQLEPEAALVLGENEVFVKLLGILPVPSDQNDESIETLTVLTEGKKVELEFDTEMWDALGRLLAYVSTDQQLTLQQQMLITGKWMVDRETDFSRRELFLLSEKKEVKDLLFLDTETEKIEPSKTVSQQSAPLEIAHNPAWDSVKFSEIFASPSPKITDGVLSEEWLELAVDAKEPFSLSGFVLQVGSKKKALTTGLNLASGSFILVSATDLKLSLKNDGALVALFSPDGLLIDSIAYPKLPHGSSFAISDAGTCVTTIPTPAASNICVVTTKAVAKSAAKKGAASPAVKKYAAYYTAQQSDDAARNIELAAPESGVEGIYLILIFALGLGSGIGGIVIANSLIFRYNGK
jgi:hypothetical protein